MDTSVFKLEPFEDHYEIGDDIGSGHFAVVRRCQHRQTGVAYAAKFIRKRRGGGRKGAKMEDIVKEINVLRSISHPNVISLYEVYDTRHEVILVLELVSGGELFEYISEKEALNEEEASAFIKQILEGVKHLHDSNIAHLDLKPENIMLLDRKTTNIKLIDFGLARKLNEKEDVRAMMGTAEFIAPEVVSFEPLSFATDMWSVGVITYILLSGSSPFLGDTQQETYHNITANNFDFDHDLFNTTSDLAKDFIRRLFVKNPRKRATVNECLSHPWIKPKEKREAVARQSAMINIDNFKSFMARKRWKQSMRVVSLCNRLSRSIQLRKSCDTLGSRNTMSSNNTLDEVNNAEADGSTRSVESPGYLTSPEADTMPLHSSEDTSKTLVKECGCLHSESPSSSIEVISLSGGSDSLACDNSLTLLASVDSGFALCEVTSHEVQAWSDDQAVPVVVSENSVPALHLSCKTDIDHSGAVLHELSFKNVEVQSCDAVSQDKDLVSNDYLKSITVLSELYIAVGDSRVISDTSAVSEQ